MSSHNFELLFHKVVYSHSLGVVSHLKAVILNNDQGRFLPKVIKTGTLGEDTGKYKRSFCHEHSVDEQCATYMISYTQMHCSHIHDNYVVN